MKINTNELTFKKLDSSIIPTLLEIQEEAFEAHEGSPDFLRRNTKETFSVCFEDKSLVLGAYYEGELAGFGILLDAKKTSENLAKDVDLIEDLLSSANVKLIIVRPKFRGNGLQRILIEKLSSYAKDVGFNYLCTTVSPVNPWSLDNFKKCGFIEFKRLEKYGGLSRVLFYKKI